MYLKLSKHLKRYTSQTQMFGKLGIVPKDQAVLTGYDGSVSVTNVRNGTSLA